MTNLNPLVPNFNSVVHKDVVLPYRDEPYARFTFSDPVLEGYEVTVIEDSIPSDTVLKNEEGNRLVTIIARFPRCVLAEVNTHRVFSRNSASSRARSIKQTIGEIMNEPYVPLFTKNKKGMSGDFLNFEDRERAVDAWKKSRDAAVYGALRLLLGDLLPVNKTVTEIAQDYSHLVDVYYEKVYNADLPDPLAISVHKQNVNRLLEPFMWHEAIITSNYWDNFEELRNNLDNAQPEIVAMARLVRAALKNSVPQKTWLHLPFVDNDVKPDVFGTFESMKDALLLSATECAQISYKDKGKASRSTATVGLGERLLKSKHLSPFEHVAFSSAVYHSQAGEDLPKDKLTSNLDDSWVQLRPVITSIVD